MASFIRARLFRAESVTEVGVSPRVTQLLMISSAWIGCSSSYLACSSSHHRPRGPIFSFLASPRSAFSDAVRGAGFPRVPERGAAAHLGQVPVEIPHLGQHRLRDLEAFLGNTKAVGHRPPHRVVPLLDPDIVPEERLPVLR